MPNVLASAVLVATLATANPSSRCLDSFFVANSGTHTVTRMDVRPVPSQDSSTGGWHGQLLPTGELAPGASVRPFAGVPWIDVEGLHSPESGLSTYEITVAYADGRTYKHVVDVCKDDLYLGY